MKTKDEVISTIEIALELEKGSLNIDTRMGSIEQWDSLGHFSFLMSIEESYNFKFSIEQMPKVTTINQILEIVNNLDHD